jgi:hypothetical protein
VVAIVLPALTGLAGAVVVAWYQGRRQSRQWLNDVRLRAYAEFIDATQQLLSALFQFKKALTSATPLP